MDALDEAVGAIGGEAELINLYPWSVSTKSSTRLVLFGRAVDSQLSEEAPYADALLTNDGSGWRLVNWGQCRIIVDAPGFGPARVVIDPDSQPDPTSSAIEVLIHERACANTA